MNQDAIQADARRDGTHAYADGANGVSCLVCGKPRWAHVNDGHRPTLSNCDPRDSRYRSCYSCHPRFSRPQSMSNADRKEINRQLRFQAHQEQKRIEQAARKARRKA